MYVHPRAQRLVNTQPVNTRRHTRSPDAIEKAPVCLTEDVALELIAAEGLGRPLLFERELHTAGLSKRASTSPVNAVVRETIMGRQVQFQSSD